MTVIFDPSSNLHPYECGGMGKNAAVRARDKLRKAAA